MWALIPVLRMHSWTDLCEFKASLVYRASSRTGSKATEKLCLKKTKPTNQTTTATTTTTKIPVNLYFRFTFLFLTGFYFVAQVSLQYSLQIMTLNFLPQPPEWWDYKHCYCTPFSINILNHLWQRTRHKG